ncbi:hypothetical protein [Kordiimonas aestuarii]|uniref:hypothetical protein n=1 Tax=Kordiimonas aestuarii TaxID=1005925 RepID=UPI0021D10DC6|nr:hypothetical protein [Kordiimonas aestuarii]
MTKILRTLFCMVAFAAATPFAQAGARQIDDATFEMLMERAEENNARLGLTPAQEERVNPILEAGRDRQLAILERYGFGRGQKPSLRLREKLKLAKEMKAVRADTESALATHLSRDQMKIYKDIQDERRARMKEFMKSRKD